MVKVRFICEIDGCGKDYSRKSTLKHHMKSVHKWDEPKQQGRFVCSLCDKPLYHATKLAAHCQNDHQQEICMKQL